MFLFACVAFKYLFRILYRPDVFYRLRAKISKFFMFLFAILFLNLYFCGMRSELEEKITRSVLLLRHAYRHVKHQGKRLEICISGGKDSDVLIELCKIAWIWGSDVLRPIHKCTTIDPAGTLRHVLAQGVEVVRPRMDFRECIERSGFPSRYVRHCCSELKEYAIEDYAVLGIRKCESVNREKMYNEPEMCRVYNGRGKAIQYYPLLDWSDEDVAEFIEERGVQCHPLYYDSGGVFHVERRLGCMCCPLASKKHRLEEFRKNPRMVRFYIRHGLRYWESHPDSSVRNYFSDVYEQFVCDVFCKSVEDFKSRFKSGFGLLGIGNVGCKQYLEEYFGINLDF